MFWRKSLNDRRLAALGQVPAGPLRDYLEVPFPDARVDWRQGRYLAIDLELTGLETDASILAAGSVPIDGPSLMLAGATHLLVRPDVEVGQSATVHGLTDDGLSAARPLEEVLPAILAELAGRTLVAHHAEIEVGFLSRACEQLYGRRLLVPAIDTMHLQRRVLRLAPGQPVKHGALRLQASRDLFGLPRYRAHEALTDAIAAGELFLAQAADLGGSDGISIQALLS